MNERNFRVALARRNLTQIAFAKRIGVHPTQLNRFVKGHLLTPVALQTQIAENQGTKIEQWIPFYPKPGRASELYLNWLLLNGGRRPKRRERMSLKLFKYAICKVKVRPAKSTPSDGELRPSCQQYSVVGAILELLQLGGNRAH